MVVEVIPYVRSQGSIGDGQGPSSARLLRRSQCLSNSLMGQLVGSFWQWPKSLLGLTLGKILTFAKVTHGLMGSSWQWSRCLPNQAIGKNMGISQGRSRANLWGDFYDGRGASSTGLLGRSWHLPRLLMNWAC